MSAKDIKFDVAFCLGSINFGNESNILNQIECVINCLNPQARIYWRCNPGLHDHGNEECETIEFFPAIPSEPKTIERFFCDVSSYLDKGDKSYISDFEKADVIDTCEIIINFLDKLVNDCEETFGMA